MFVFRKFDVLYFLETPILRFALLPNYRRNIHVSGTLTENQTRSFRTALEKEIDNFKQGEIDFRTTSSDKLAKGGWKDNKLEYVASYFDSIEPMLSMQKWNKEIKYLLLNHVWLSATIKVWEELTELLRILNKSYHHKNETIVVDTFSVNPKHCDEKNHFYFIIKARVLII